MSPEDKKDLEYMCRKYGMYHLVKHLAAHGRKECNGDYANNQDAIIHIDTEIMENAASLMKDLHPLRSV